MRKEIILIFICFFNFFYSQNLKVEYEYINKKNINHGSFSDKFNKKLLDLNGKPVYYTLLYNKGNSLFTKNEEKDIINEKSRVTNGNETKVEIERIVRKGVKIFHNAEKKGFYKYCKYDEDEFYWYSEPELTSISYKDDVEFVDIYKCKLVEIVLKNGTLVKLWYTEDIPISTGPFMYNMLPGLVLKAESSGFIVYATKVSNTKEIMESINSKLPIYNDEEYNKKMKEINNSVKTTRTEILK